MSALRRLCCTTTVPVEPAKARITADGFRVKVLVP
jgi:hypothetical protein